jgi:hypothetical protein
MAGECFLYSYSKKAIDSREHLLLSFFVNDIISRVYKIAEQNRTDLFISSKGDGNTI